MKQQRVDGVEELEQTPAEVSPTAAVEVIDRIRAAVGSAFLGKPEVVEAALVALLADGHLLIEDVPGVGKTLLARAIAQSIDCSFSRIQFTPDLLPSDIIGSSIYDQSTASFTFQPGPLFAHVVLADEINRTSPRTQSALLEAMSDRQISVDGRTYPLRRPFLVLATQNPFEFEGTYPLPESQLDRFLLRAHIGYPHRDQERQLLSDHRLGEPIDQVRPAIATEELTGLQDYVRRIPVAGEVEEYLLNIVDASRNHRELYVGASIRGSLMLYRAAQALALLRGRHYVVPDDVKQLAVPVLSHRVVPKNLSAAHGAQAATGIVERIVANTPVPG